MTMLSREEMTGLKEDEEAFQGISPSGEKRNWIFSVRKLRKIKKDKNKKSLVFRAGEKVGKFVADIFALDQWKGKLFVSILILAVGGVLGYYSFVWLWPWFDQLEYRKSIREYCFILAVLWYSYRKTNSGIL